MPLHFSNSKCTIRNLLIHSVNLIEAGAMIYIINMYEDFMLRGGGQPQKEGGSSPPPGFVSGM